MSKITFMATIMLYDTSNVPKKFFIQQQYDYTSKTVMHYSDINTKNVSIPMMHYTIEVDSRTFNIPDLYCLEYDDKIGIYNESSIELTNELLVDKKELERKIYSNEDDAPNVTAQYKLMLGRNITNEYKPDVCYELEKLRNKDVQKNNPGKK